MCTHTTTVPISGNVHKGLCRWEKNAENKSLMFGLISPEQLCLELLCFLFASEVCLQLIRETKYDQTSLDIRRVDLDFFFCCSELLNM